MPLGLVSRLSCSKLSPSSSSRVLVDTRCRATSAIHSPLAPNPKRTFDANRATKAPMPRRRPRRRPPPSIVASAVPNRSASEAVAALLDAVATGNEEALLDFVSEEAAVAIAERTALRRRRVERRSGKDDESSDDGAEDDDGDESASLQLTPLTLDDVVRAARPGELSLDSFAVRCLLLSPKPLRSEPRLLSGLSLSATRFVARAEVVLRSGEVAALTLELSQEERAVSHYRSVRTEKHWTLSSACGEPGKSSGGGGGDGSIAGGGGGSGAFGDLATSPPSSSPSARDPRDGPEVVLESFLAALSSGDGAAVSELVSPPKAAAPRSSARMLADAVGASAIFASPPPSPPPPSPPPSSRSSPPSSSGKSEADEGDEERGFESTPPWHRPVDDEGNGVPSTDGADGIGIGRGGTRFPRELEPLVALFLSGSSYDVLSLKMLSATSAWGMAGVRPFGDDGRGFILGGQLSRPPSPASSTSPSWWQRQLEQQQQEGKRQEGQGASRGRRLQHPRAAFIFRLELSDVDNCWEVRDVARVGGGGGFGEGGGDDVGGGALFPLG